MTPTAPTAPKILWIDRDAQLAAAMAVLLRHYGYEVTTVATRSAARKLVEAADVVVLDPALPDGDGFELISQARAAAHPPVIAAVSATFDDAFQRGVRRLRPERTFRKPLNFIDLLVAIRSNFAPAVTEPVMSRRGREAA